MKRYFCKEMLIAGVCLSKIGRRRIRWLAKFCGYDPT